jgi:hypothetical protein
LLFSNNKFICRLGVTAAGNLGEFIAFLRNDCDIAPGVCGDRAANQQPLQLNECGQFDTRRANGHRRANHGIKHPTSHRNHDAGWPFNLKK